MRYILVDTGWNTRRLVKVAEEKDFQPVMSHLCKRYTAVREAPSPPSLRTLRRWKASKKARAFCGCWVNGLDRCQKHDTMSWLTALIGLTNKKELF